MALVTECEDKLWNAADLPKPSRDGSVLKHDVETYGYCIIDRALTGATPRAIQDRILDQARAERRFHNLKNPANLDPVNQWVGMLLNKGEIFFHLIEHPLCMSIVEHLIGKDYVISCVDSQIQHPGAGIMPLHTDQWWMPGPQRPGTRADRPAEARRNMGTSLDSTPSLGSIAPIAAANVMWVITDFTEENGATRLVPRSHLSGCQPDPSVPHKIPSVPAVAPAGSAIAFDARLWHGAGANHTDTLRCGITTVGCGPQFRQLENYPRGLRQEVIDRCSPETLRRIGFGAWCGYSHTGDPDAVVTATGAEALGELRSEDWHDAD